jgi:hypothetical protein
VAEAAQVDALDSQAIEHHLAAIVKQVCIIYLVFGLQWGYT